MRSETRSFNVTAATRKHCWLRRATRRSNSLLRTRNRSSPMPKWTCWLPSERSRERRRWQAYLPSEHRFLRPLMTLRFLWGKANCRTFAAAVACFFILSACALTPVPTLDNDRSLRQTAELIREVKAFGQTLGIEPTEALSRTTQERPTLSLLWLWLQREGTLALRTPIDIR